MQNNHEVKNWVLAAPVGLDLKQIKHLRVDQVIDALGIGERTWLRWVKQGQAPGAIRLGPGVVAWRLADVQAWLDSRPAAGAAGGAV